MTAHTVSILSRIAKTTSLCLGLLAVAQFSTYASTRIPEESEHLQSHSLTLVASADDSRTVVNSSGPYYTPSNDSESLPKTLIGGGHRADDSRTVVNSSGPYYTPSNDSEPLPGTPIGGGHRGGNCNINGTSEFMTLGPQSMVGLTTQVQPEFSWYISPSEEGASLTFRLIQFDENAQRSIVDAEQMTAQAGFMSYQPSDASLELGRDYLWQIVLECNGKLLMSTSLVRAVPSNAELTAQLSTVTTNAERAVIYSDAELWYDAFAQVMLGTTSDDRTVRSGLLQDLAAAEEEKNNQASSAILLAILEQTDDR